MSEFLVIHYKPGQHLDPNDSSLHYWALGADLHPSITLGQGTLDDLQPIARGKKVTLLIDAHYTTLESVNVPSKNRNRQLQAVPYAMEDMLAEDIEDTHFSLGKSSTDQQARIHIPVIAISRQLLKDILQHFAHFNIYPDIATADSIAIPGDARQWCILLDEDSALIKLGETRAHCCDRENLPLILQALLEQTDEQPDSILYYHKADDSEALSLLDSGRHGENAAPSSPLQIEGEPEETADPAEHGDDHPAFLRELNIELQTQTYQNHPLEVFVQHLKYCRDFNLLHGEFAVRRQSSTWLKAWKPAAILAAVWLGLHLSYAAIMGKQLEKKNMQLSRQIEQEFRRALPEARKMTNIRKRLQRRLKDLQGGANTPDKSGFLMILSKVSPVLSKNKKLKIQAAVFRNNYVDIDLTAASLQDIEQVKNQLSSIPGIHAVLSTSVEKDSVKGRLRVEAKS